MTVADVAEHDSEQERERDHLLGRFGVSVWGVGFGVWGVGCGSWGVGFGVAEFGVWGGGCRRSGFGCRVA